VLTAYEAVIHVQGKNGKRDISAGDFFTDLFATSLKDDEVVTGVEIRNQSSMKSAYAKMSHPASRYAVVGVCVSLAVSGGTCSSARVAVGGATVKAVRCPKAEAALTGSKLDSAALDAAAAAVQSDIADALTGDMTFPKEYRQAMAGVYFKRAVQSAMG
jgi:carbon-monoxide dehydrogenase medium subunit